MERKDNSDRLKKKKKKMHPIMALLCLYFGTYTLTETQYGDSYCQAMQRFVLYPNKRTDCPCPHYHA